MPPSIHVNRELFIKALIYGVPGSGKTTLAASSVLHPLMSKVLFISIEGGMLSVPSSPNVIYEEVRNTDNKTAIEKIEDYFWQLAQIPSGKSSLDKEIRTVVIDSASEALTLTLEGIVKKRGGTTDDIWLQDYGKSTASLKRLFRYFRDLPMNVIVTALAQDVMEGKGETAVRVAVEPSFTLKLRESVKGVFDHVWYLYRRSDGEEETYHMLTRTKGLYYGKTRGQRFAPALGMRVDNPSMPNIYDLLLKTEGNDK